MDRLQPWDRGAAGDVSTDLLLLPTPAESKYAVSGGDLHSTYPLGNASVPDGVDDSYARGRRSSPRVEKDGDSSTSRDRMAEWRWGSEPYTVVDVHLGTSAVQRGSFRGPAQLLPRLDVNSTCSAFTEVNWGSVLWSPGLPIRKPYHASEDSGLRGLSSASAPAATFSLYRSKP